LTLDAVLVGVIAGVVVLAIWRVAVIGWVKFQSPILLKKDMENWSTNDKKMISDAGYDLAELVWIPDYDIGGTPYKPVLIGWWILKREVHAPEKVGFMQLFEKTAGSR